MVGPIWVLRQPDTSGSWKEVNPLLSSMDPEPELWGSSKKEQEAEEKE